MLISEIVEILDARILNLNEQVDKVDIKSAFGSDMMSDVLAYVNDQGLLLTGLVNTQVVRTAEMMDIPCIIFVRGKTPEANIIELATSKNIVLLSTQDRMYSACGKLFKKGLPAGN